MNRTGHGLQFGVCTQPCWTNPRSWAHSVLSGVFRGFVHPSDEAHRTRPTIRSVPTTSGSSNRVVFGLAGSLVLSALYDSVPNQRFEAEFEHLRLPRWFRPLLVLAKTSAATGLLIGLRSS